jgi:hypothetical protein
MNQPNFPKITQIYLTPSYKAKTLFIFFETSFHKINDKSEKAALETLHQLIEQNMLCNARRTEECIP